MAINPPDPGIAYPAAMLKLTAPNTGQWYYVAGRINTSASYTWYGVNTYSNQAVFNYTLGSPIVSSGGINNFLNPAQRTSSIPTPQAGAISFIRQNASGTTVNELDYYDGAAWQPVSTGGGGGGGGDFPTFFLMGA